MMCFQGAQKLNIENDSIKDRIKPEICIYFVGNSLRKVYFGQIFFKENKFCGWFDANLSEAGKAEAVAGGKALKEAGYSFDVAHTSLLTR